MFHVLVCWVLFACLFVFDTGTHCVAQVYGLLLPQYPECWDDRRVPPRVVLAPLISWGLVHARRALPREPHAQHLRLRFAWATLSSAGS